MAEIILSLAGGLALFLYAVLNLSETVKEWAGERARHAIARFTTNIISAIIVGCLATIVLDSSTAVIILTIVLVNASILTFRQSIGIVLGANIGTTVSSQIIALDVSQYSPVFLIAGLILIFVFGANNSTVNRAGKVLLFFGMLFFGLLTMERAVEPLRDNQQFFELLKQLENPLYGAAVGTFVTVIVQSSSATVAMVLTLAKESLITLPAGLAVMLGAELGTCADTLLATVRSTRQALKTGLFHLFFNLTTIILGLVFFEWFVVLTLTISGASAEIKGQIANAHVLFNVLGVLLFVGFVPLFERILNKLIPDATEAETCAVTPAAA
jgi:phosphate:Na+ symporter